MAEELKQEAWVSVPASALEYVAAHFLALYLRSGLNRRAPAAHPEPEMTDCPHGVPHRWSCGECDGGAQPEPAAPALTTCNCRWDGETQVQQCTLHEAHVQAIHEWAERAKAAESKAAPAVVEPWDAKTLSRLAHRVMTWQLPADLCADDCAGVRGFGTYGRTGTNLMTHALAEAMLRHVLAAHPPRAPLTDAEVDRLRLCEWRLAAVTRWLEGNQPDVFKRGLWDAVIAADRGAEGGQ